MNLIEKSLQIALNAYSGKKDKAGETYILHPLRVMGKLNTLEEKVVAILHDVIEDSDYTADDLLSEEIPKHIVEAVISLTRNSDESYSEFIERVSLNALARSVKIADIEDNLNILRLKTIQEKDLKRLEKYYRAHIVLKKR